MSKSLPFKKDYAEPAFIIDISLPNDKLKFLTDLIMLYSQSLKLRVKVLNAGEDTIRKDNTVLKLMFDSPTKITSPEELVSVSKRLTAMQSKLTTAVNATQQTQTEWMNDLVNTERLKTK